MPLLDATNSVAEAQPRVKRSIGKGDRHVRKPSGVLAAPKQGVSVSEAKPNRLGSFTMYTIRQAFRDHRQQMRARTPTTCSGSMVVSGQRGSTQPKRNCSH